MVLIEGLAQKEPYLALAVIYRLIEKREYLAQSLLLRKI